ncbi:MAG: glutathione synthase, partial [Cyclobacteriaceae bacterium]
MKICMLINDVATEKNFYTTTALSMKLIEQDHTLYYLTIDDLTYYSGDLMGGMAWIPSRKKYKSRDEFLIALREKSERKRITSKDIDILFLRNDPAKEPETRPWAKSAGITFGQMAIRQNVLVLNDPDGLSHALSKFYLKMFPQDVRPKSTITRNLEEIKEFYQQNDENIIIKPLQGSGGTGVFHVSKENINNLKQIMEANSRNGFVIAQQFLPEARNGDVRVFMLNGEPLVVDGKLAAINRKPGEGDFRSNLHAGGSVNKAKVTDRMFEIMQLLKPKLIQDGMFLVGLDVIG